MRHRTVWLLPLCLLAMLSSVRRALGAVSATERQQAFAWFDTLGYPPITKLPLARVYDGEWTEQVDQQRKPSYSYGFIAESDKEHFVVVRFTLWTESLMVRPATAQNEPVHFEPVDLQSYAREQIRIRTSANTSYFPDDRELPVEFFLLARACEARGQSNLAARLCDLADEKMGSPEPGKPAPSFRDRLADEFARFEIWRLMLDFGDTGITRETLLHRFETFLRRFPKGKYSPLAAEMSGELTRMVPEDQAHRTLPVPSKSDVPTERRIADLVFALRDQNGRQWSQPGSCDVFADPRGEKSPAAQLVQIGLPAVPALIEAMTDSRLTRSVEFWRDFVFSHRVLRVGDVAQAILQKIAQRRFESNLDGKSNPSWREMAAASQVVARKWWLQVQSRGEAAVLAESVQCGDDMSVGAAESLVARFPDAALPALKKGIEQATEDEYRRGLVKVAGNLPGSAVLPFLEKQMREGRDLGTRVLAASALSKRGDPSAAIRCMENEWRRLKSGEDVLDDSPEELCRFLIDSGSPETIRILGDGLLARSAEARIAVIQALSDEDAGAFAGQPSRSAAMQRVLAELLLDRYASKGRYSYFGQTSLANFRICDAANAAFAYFWPDAYDFHPSSSLFERDRECLLMLNRWRVANGLKSLPLPARPVIPRTNHSALLALLSQWRHADSPRQRARREAEILQIGLAAVPAVRAVRQQMTQSSPDALALLALEKRLCCIVREVHVESSGFAMGAERMRRLNRLKGRPFTAGGCSDLVNSLMRRLPLHASGLRLYAYRDNDGSGFLIRVTYLHGAEKFSRKSFRQSDDITAGSFSVLSSGGATSGADVVKEFGMKEAEKAVQDALSSRPDTPVSIELEREFVPDS